MNGIEREELPLDEENGESTAEIEADIEQPLNKATEEESEPQKEDAPLTEDLSELANEFPELRGISELTELNNSARYEELRALGLSAREAYLATRTESRSADNRSHLYDGFPRAARSPLGAMSKSELCEARELFSDLSDAQIIKLYKKVTA